VPVIDLPNLGAISGYQNSPFQVGTLLYHRKNLLSASILITRRTEQVGLSKDYLLFSSLSYILRAAGKSDLWSAYPTRNWIM